MLIDTVDKFDIDGSKIFYNYRQDSIYVHCNLFNKYVNLMRIVAPFQYKFLMNNIDIYIQDMINDYNKGITILYPTFVKRFTKYFMKNCYNECDKDLFIYLAELYN